MKLINISTIITNVHFFQQLMLNDINSIVGMLMKLKVFYKHTNILFQINISMIIFLFMICFSNHKGLLQFLRFN